MHPSQHTLSFARQTLIYTALTTHHQLSSFHSSGKTWYCTHRQKGCTEQDDLLRPYSSLDYAWDEPALPHKLLLELPGNRRLGEYDLDSVGHHWFVNVAATSQRAEQRIMVCVRADGPKRVLELIDLLVSHHSAFSIQHVAIYNTLDL